MTEETPLTSYRLTPPGDIRSALEVMEFDHLIVDTARTLVIFRNAVLNLEVRHGTLATAEQVRIEVLDSPAQPTDATDTFDDQFLEQLAAVTESDWREITST